MSTQEYRRHETPTRYEARFGESLEETARHIREAGDVRRLVLWSFHSLDATYREATGLGMAELEAGLYGISYNLKEGS